MTARGRWGPLLLLLVLAAACGGNDETIMYLHNVTVARAPEQIPAGGIRPARAARGHEFLSVRLRFPKYVAAADLMHTPVLLTSKGGFNAVSYALHYGEGQATFFAATFEIPQGAQHERMAVGRYDFDFGHSFVRRLQD